MYLVGRVNGAELMLHEAGKLTEFLECNGRENRPGAYRRMRPTLPFCDRIDLKISRGPRAYYSACLTWRRLLLSKSANSGLRSRSRSEQG